METDGRLVENVAYASEMRAELRGQPHPLRFTTGKSVGAPRELQVGKADFQQQLEPGLDFLEKRGGDRERAPTLFELARSELVEELEHAVRCQSGDVCDRATGHAHRTSLRVYPAAAARSARPFGTKLRKEVT